MSRAALVGALWICLGLAVLAAACGKVNGAAPYVAAGDGAKVCSTFSNDLQATSSNWAIAGWVAGLVAAVLSAMGGILGTGETGAKWFRKALGVFLATLGGSLAATSAYSVSRSNAASSAAASASLSLSLRDDHDMYDKCVEARATWLDSRIESLDQTAPPQSRKTSAPAAATSGKGDGERHDKSDAATAATSRPGGAPAAGNE